MSKRSENAAQEALNSQFIFDERGGMEVRNAVILWPNFSGKENIFGNSARTFNLVVTEEVAKQLEERNWRVRTTDNGEGFITYYVNIKVNMESAFPPIVTLYSEYRGKKSRRTLDVNNIGEVDRIDIESCDMIISAYTSLRFPDKVTGYLRKLNIIQNPKVEFGGKYDDWLDEEAPSDVNEAVPF